MKKSTEVSPEVATAKQIRTVGPDAIVSPFESVYTDDGAGTREEWKDLSGALLYSIFDGAPYIGGKLSIAQDIFDLTGVKNVFEDANEAWPELSWEALADKDPDFIVLADLPGRGAPGDKAEEKIEMLEKDPATRNLKAVKEKRYVIVKGIGLSGSVQSYAPLEDVAEYVKNWKN